MVDPSLDKLDQKNFQEGGVVSSTLTQDGKHDKQQSGRSMGLGGLAVIPDFLLLTILFSLDSKDLLTLSLVSKAMYVLSGDEEMWKQKCTDQWEKGELKFKGLVDGFVLV